MSLRRFPRRQALIILGALGLAGGLGGLWINRGRGQGASKTVWTMIDVCSNPRNLQADAHLLEFPDGRRLLVDAGDAAGTLGPFLKAKGVARLHAVLLTHAHRDHYAGLEPLLQAGLRVDKVYMNAFPAREPCDAEIPWGCAWEEWTTLPERLNRLGAAVLPVSEGMNLYARDAGGVETSLDVVCAFDAEHTPVGRTDINDASVVLMLRHGPTRALLGADLNGAIGGWLAAHRDLRAAILKAPHHGAEGMPPDAFFAAVGAQTVLVPAPAELWSTPRCGRTRAVHEAGKAAFFVSGLHGHVQVEMSPTGYVVTPERVG